MLSALPRLPVFSRELEEQFRRKHETNLDEILPTIGPLFSLLVLLFTSWDYLIDSDNAPLSSLVRIFFVLVGLTACRKTRIPWTPSQRVGFIYCMQGFAIIVGQYILQDGFRYGQIGVICGMFVLAVVASGPRAFVWSALPPLILYAVLTAIALPRFEFFNGMVLYLLAFHIAFASMLIVRYLRRKAYYLEDELAHRASHDSLTGLFNRGYLNELGVREMALARRHDRPLAIAMLDIDRFKAINDTFGHDVGDLALKALADTCRDTVRQIDHVGRFGGEEFVCIMPETDAPEALACAERLRQNVAAMRIDSPRGIVSFTISIGIALHSPEHPDWEGLVKEADTAMYRAKQAGRNCIRFADNASVEPVSPSSTLVSLHAEKIDDVAQKPA